MTQWEPEPGQRAVVWTADPAPAAGARPPKATPENYARTGLLVAVLLVLSLVAPHDFPWFIIVPVCVLFLLALFGSAMIQRNRQRRPTRLAALTYDPVGHWLTLRMPADQVTVELAKLRQVQVLRSGPASARLRIVLTADGFRYDTGDTTAESARPVLDALRADGARISTDPTGS